MKVIHDKSYGVVPLYKSGDEWKVLLIHQISYRGVADTFWTLPKGHPEEGESPQQAARRELSEETGITEVTLDDRKEFETSYRFVHDGMQIKKTVVFWVGFCASDTVYISQPKEIKALHWCSFAEANELLTHQNSKEILQEIQEFLA